jgi:hypothetical protein
MSRARATIPPSAVLALVAFAVEAPTRRASTQQAAGPPAPVPVEAVEARAADVPLTLQGIGTAQAFSTVAVHARVDGELQRIRFTEGQAVHAGDVLAQIDPRPYQAAYDQAVAKKAQQDEAIREARLLRFRPILMAAMAAPLGGLPLMLGTGTGSEVRQPLGYAMVSGLAVSQLLTLYKTPAVSFYLGRLQRLFRRTPGAMRPAGIVAARVVPGER